MEGEVRQRVLRKRRKWRKVVVDSAVEHSAPVRGKVRGESLIVRVEFLVAGGGAFLQASMLLVIV